MKLMELFNSTYKYQTTAGPGSFQASFNTDDGSLIKFKSSRFDGNWEISFTSSDENGDRTYDATNRGDAFKIMATIKAIIEEFLETSNPKSVYWTGEMDSGHAKLYSRMMANFRHPNYDASERQGKNGSFKVFTLTRKA